MGFRCCAAAFSPSRPHGSQLVLIVNHKLAQHYWPDQDPIGKHIRIGTPEMQTPWLTVVGEVADVMLASPDQPAKSSTTFPSTRKSTTMARSPSPPIWPAMAASSSFAPSCRRTRWRTPSARRSGPSIRCCRLRRCKPWNRQSRRAKRRAASTPCSFRGFAFAAVLLAVLGIYSIIAFSVASRVQEMAIRMALGSRRGGHCQPVLEVGRKAGRRSDAPSDSSGRGASGLLRSFLFGVSPFDPFVLSLAAFGVLCLHRRFRTRRSAPHPSTRCAHCGPNSPVAPPMRIPRSLHARAMRGYLDRSVPRPCDFFLSQGRETTCPIVRQQPPHFVHRIAWNYAVLAHYRSMGQES